MDRDVWLSAYRKAIIKGDAERAAMLAYLLGLVSS